MQDKEKIKNARQMPKTKEYLSNKGYSDIVYAWLQVNSLFDEEKKVRYINKKDIKFTEIGKALGITRQTASNRFKGLMNLGLVCDVQELNRYELVLLNKELGFLVQRDTLRKMVSALNENSINVYVYLYNRYCAEKQGYDFTIDQIKNMIGISTKTRSNNYIITDILEVLEILGLIEYEVRDVIKNGEYKTNFHLKKVNSDFKKNIQVGREVKK